MQSELSAEGSCSGARGLLGVLVSCQLSLAGAQWLAAAYRVERLVAPREAAQLEVAPPIPPASVEISRRALCGPRSVAGVPGSTGRSPEPAPLAALWVVELGARPDRPSCFGPDVHVTGLVELEPHVVYEGCVGHFEALEGAGSSRVVPSGVDYARMLDDRATKVEGIVKVCIDRAGHSTATTMVVSTGYPGYDATLLAAARGWRFDAPAPGCGLVGFTYQDLRPTSHP
jgi:TonB family protein